MPCNQNDSRTPSEIFVARPVIPVEWHRQILEKLRSVREHAGSELIECLDRKPAGICGTLNHYRRNSADQHSFGNSLAPVPPNVACNLAAACRMSDMFGNFKVQFLCELGKIVGIVSMSLPFHGWLDLPWNDGHVRCIDSQGAQTIELLQPFVLF